MTQVEAAPRPLGLTLLLAALIAAMLFGGSFGLTHRAEFFARFPRFTSPLWYAYLACVPLGIAANVALLLWRRWGFYLVGTTSLLLAGIELYVGVGPKLLRVPVSLALLAVLARPHWARFR